MKTRRQRWLMGWLLLAVALLMPNPSGGAWAQTSVTTSKPAQGDGSSSNPFIISSAQELAWFRDWVNGTYTPADGESAATHSDACAKISDDVEEIDLSTVCGKSIGTWKPIGTEDSPWQSSFDGNHKTIKNLYINSSDKYQGLFGYIYDNQKEGIIKDICFKDVDANCSETNLGIIAGYAHYCTISGIQILSGTIKGNQHVGGILGFAYNCHLLNNENHINITSSDIFAGGMIGYAFNSTIEKCTNQGNIEPAEGANPSCFGGIAGLTTLNTTLSNCINSGNIKASENVGGLIGIADTGNMLKSCITYGNVESTNASSAGLAIGNANVQTLENVLFLSDATLKKHGQTVAAQAFGYAPSSGVQAIGMNQDLIKNGFAACLLQQSAGEDGVWGQQLGTDTYPVLGSAHTVYADNVSITCIGTIIQGSFTNTQPASGSQLTTSHGTAIYHPAVAYTCTDNGSVAYYECSDCHKNYNDEQLTEQLASITDYTHGHEYTGDMCTLCQRQTPTLVDGTHAIQIEKVIGARKGPGCYNLYKYIANSNGTLTVYTTGENDTYGTLWNSDLSKELTYNDDGEEDNNFLFTYEVEKGKTYYIGVRSYGGSAIEGDYQLTIKMDAEDGTEVLVGTLDGKDIMGTKQGDAYIVANLDLADGKQMTLLKDNVQLQGGTYTRTFSNDKWQPLFVPFELEVTEELLTNFELAAPNNLHEYELSDGSTKVVLEAKKMKSGNTIKALRPYLIRAKEAGEKTIQLADCPLKGATEDTYVSCSSVLRHYKFIGTLKGKTSFDPTADFVLSEGLFYAADANAQLKPMRWYLNATDSGTDMGINSGSSSDTGSEDDTSIFSRSIDISIINGDATTGIDDIHVITDQADGSFSVGNLSSGSRRGIYDLQGRKLSKEPKSGIYIKDGKKMVR